jgi:pimeloyl-ACP methyl ester carboxylesterase
VVFFVLASSALQWSSFSLVGFSLGGGLAANFASYFPNLVSDLVLIAPGGLLRKQHITWQSRLFYSSGLGSWFPGFQASFVWGRLWTDMSKEGVIEPEAKFGAAAKGIVESSRAETSETSGAGILGDDEKMSFLLRTPDNEEAKAALVCNSAVNRTLMLNPYFIPSFVSTLQHAPIHAQQERWEKIRCPTLVVLGGKDPIVKADEVETDVKAVFEASGQINSLSVEVIKDADHNIPIRWPGNVTNLIRDFWGDV